MHLSDLAGEMAALGTATCWSVSSLAFEAAGRRVGSMAVNLVRLVMAFALLTAFGFLVRGHALPTDAPGRAWGWLSLSGLVGFTLGDLCLFRAFVVLGPRLSTLVLSSTPLLTALIARAILGELLSPRDTLGMLLTVAGIAWALAERVPARDGRPVRRPARGVFLAFGGALGQAGGLVLSKLGMGSYDAFASTQIRVVAGIAGFGLLFLALRWWPRVVRSLNHGKAMALTFLGAFFGPFLGVSLSLFAVQHTKAGIAASLMALTPILVLPLVVVIHKERVGLGGVFGACIAVAGAVLLCT